MAHGLRTGLLLLLGLSTLGGQAQTEVQPYAETSLTQAFADLRSGDPRGIAFFHNGHANSLLDKELPTIEKDTAAICGALSDKDSFVRLQASAILVTIVVAAPQHNSVVQACFPNLIKAASDPVDQASAQSLKASPPEQARNNSLFALAMNPAAPPQAAHDVFVAVQTEAINAVAATAKDHATAASAIQGLLDSPTATKEQKLKVRMALGTAPQ
ncbi:MAG TPA: hypothetical protein VFW25_11285 [Silvibacterium sp.]|nr:hypothetical protein [Silvibacterium sp.]